ncbi:MAG: FAD:protein FMN transferase [Eubacterium sp.]|nr:FAD:protein FMN transferase [Eubacterium sp.]
MIMKRIISVFLIIATLLSLSACSQGEKRYEKSFIDLFDTASTLIAYDVSQESFDEHFAQLHEKLEEYNRLFDIYHDYDGINNIKTLNDTAGTEPVEVDERIIDLLLYGKELYRLSGGNTNICFGAVLEIWHDYREKGINDPDSAELPEYEKLLEASGHTDIDDLVINEEDGTVYFADGYMKLDVGAIAKGYACREVCKWAKENLWQSFALSLGGNVYTAGLKEDGERWNISVENPDTSSQEALCTVRVSGLSVVTSGDYQRYYTVEGRNYCHIINTETLMPSEYFSGITVICEDSALADALSTTLFNMPYEDGRELVEGLDGVEALWCDKEYKQYYSSGFEEFIN